VELAALGALVVTVTQSELFGPVVAVVRAWLAGSPQRSIKLELDGDVLELTAVSSREQRRLTDEWLRRHQRR
jgi:HSP20 family molecular chaperone IbpA